ncbi:YcaO-like family protein [Mesorhizobium sp. M1312]|uniref:YcaO-like family protein n=1 Tax=unclassified Mesorhizobium TaxID=325217 RepID=UPI003335A747
MAIAFIDGCSELARVGELFDVINLPVTDVPAHFAIAIPKNALLQMPVTPRSAMPETGRLASGRGLSMDDCRASCLGEAAELFSCCSWGDEPLITATVDEIGSAAIAPESLNGFSSHQIVARGVWNKENIGFDWRPPIRDESAALDWLKVEDAFGGDGAFIPADFAFIGRKEAGEEGAVAIGDSSGCAAGPSADAAKLAAILELVERDATGRWWYGRRQRQIIDPSCLSGIDALVDWLWDRERRTWLFDITSDIDIPVIAAASAEPEGKDVSLGFAAGKNLQSAATAALTEMLQMEISLGASRALGDEAGAWSRWREKASMKTPPLNMAPIQHVSPSLPHPAVERDLSDVLNALAHRGIDLWFAEMTRAEIGIPVFRAVSTLLCHYKPRFGRARLFAPDACDLSFDTGSPADQPLLLV